MREIFRLIAINLLSLMRPWWKHPRFHFWHYRLTFYPWTFLKRWLFHRHSDKIAHAKCESQLPWVRDPRLVTTS